MKLQSVPNAFGIISNLINDSVGSLYDELREMVTYRPIGLLYKDYGMMRSNLSKNIGQATIQDTIGSISSWRDYRRIAPKLKGDIGYVAQIDQVLIPSPWFYTDTAKREHADYRKYLESVNVGNPLGYFVTSSKSTTSPSVYESTTNSLLADAQPNVIRSFNWQKQGDPWGNVNMSVITKDGEGQDTRLGAVSAYLLKKTVEHSINYASDNDHAYSYYNDPSVEQNTSNQATKGKYSITQGAYSNFGINGKYGMVNGEYNRPTDKVRWKNEDFIGDIIPWSTTDHLYNSLTVLGKNGNVKLVQSILGLESQEGLTDYNWQDIAQQIGGTNTYQAFGNFYSITYSLGLIGTSGSKTVEYITRSLLGYDLLSDNAPSKLEYLDNIIGTHPKKYYASLGTRGTTYLDAITATRISHEKYSINGTEQIVRLNIYDPGNDNSWARETLYAYAEAEGNSKGSPYIHGRTNKVWNEGVTWGRYKTYDSNELAKKEDIIAYTNKRFLENKYETIIARFHTKEFDSATDARANRDFTSSAISKYGMSHGRNLLKGTPQGVKTNGYTNPYCRTWTFHNQYSKIKDLIRPFGSTNGVDLEKTWISNYRTVGGTTRLQEHTVLNHKNGMVRITPTAIDGTEATKRTMFSIENLAWKDYTDRLNKEQIGPLGGRIMWFPPYDLSWNEQVGVQWNETQFIGRGEKIPTYTDTDRKGNLSFSILIDHPSCINQFGNGVIGGYGIGDVDDVGSNEQTLLRFFAGCEILANNNGGNSKRQNPSNNNSTTPQEVIPLAKNEKKATFFVYFPNNYSGVDDREGKIDPIAYLLDGAATQNFEVNGDVVEIAPNYAVKSGDDVNSINYAPGYECSLFGLDNYQDGTLKKGLSRDAAKKTKYFTEKRDDFFSHHIYNTLYENIVPIKYQPKQQATNPYYGYRCDKVYASQKLRCNSEVDNYLDTKSFGLNTWGYLEGAKGRYDTQYPIFSLYHVFCAIHNDSSAIKTMEDKMKHFRLGEKLDKNKVNELKDLINSCQRISRIIVTGYASKDGYNDANASLAKHRAITIATWLRKNKKFAKADLERPNNLNITGNSVKTDDVNAFDSKKWRCAKVELVFEMQDVSAISNINAYDNKQSKNIINDVKDYVGDTMGDLVDGARDSVRSLSYSTVYEQANRERDASAEQKASYSAEKVNSKRYGDEYKFFKELKNTDPFLHSKLVEKFKYFDPAFHSITPEGFVERLTFLHQCTRQGPTISASDNNISSTAVNLAFGRPPILVLRLGDFYYTRIIVTSLSIDFQSGSGVKWDLNPEGIGVMPMFAKINMSITFLGGSELGGPIRRLQNAVSFNYYANTSAFDDRADTVEFGSEGQEVKFNSQDAAINQTVVKESDTQVDGTDDQATTEQPNT